MSYGVNKLSWNVSSLVRKLEEGNIDFSVPIQRGLVWDVKRNSKLIDAVICDIPVNYIWLNKIGDCYEGLDGKQRTNALRGYINGEYALWAGLDTVVNINGEPFSIAKKKFKKLPKELQDKILEANVDVYWLDNANTEEKKKVFSYINNGVSLKPADLNRLDIKARKEFLALTEHEAIKNWVSVKWQNKFVDEDILQDVFVMMYSEAKSLVNKDRSVFLKNTEMTSDQEKEIQGALDYLFALYNIMVEPDNKKILTKMKAKTHSVSLIYAGIIARRKKISKEKYIERMMKFFSGEGKIASISKEYNQAVSSGSTKETQVKVRIEEIEKALGK